MPPKDGDVPVEPAKGKDGFKNPFAMNGKKGPTFRASGVGGIDTSTGVEGATKDSKNVATRIVAYKATQERYKQEEDYDRIQEQLDDGRMTEEEARKLVARSKLHSSGAEVQPEFAMAAADFASATQILESHLDVNPEKQVNPVLLWFLRKVRLDKFHVRALTERKKRVSKNYVHRYPRLKKFVDSSFFDLAVGSVMVANGAMLGLQASDPDNADFGTMDSGFTAFFIIEIILRVAVDGWTWFWEWGNTGDTVLVVVTGVVPLWILGPLGVDAQLIRPLGVLRVLRLVRLVRMVRTYSIFRIFWSLIQGILDSGKALLYTYVIMAMVLYIFAIFAVYLIGKDPVFEDDSFAHRYFGDVPKAMFTFFQVITLDSWGEICRPLMKKSAMVAPLFIVVLLVVTLALLNLVVAVVVNNAFDRAKQDEELLASKKHEEMEQEAKELSEMFFEIDTDGSGMLSKDEYDDALKHNEDVVAKFDLFEINPNEYQDMWDLLDEGSGEVDVSRFADLFRSLRGDAKAKDTFSILRRLEGANAKILRISSRLEQHRAEATKIRGQATEVRQNLGILQTDMANFIKEMGPCVPGRPWDIQVPEIEKFSAKLAEEALQHDGPQL